MDYSCHTDLKDAKSDIANPFVIKKRKQSGAGPLRSTCVFKKPLPRSIFYDLFQKISAAPIETSKLLNVLKIDPNDAAHLDVHAFYMVDINAFKRGIYLDVVRPFMDTMVEYYHPSHSFYAKRPMSSPTAFAHFIQVIRHICKYAGLAFESTLKYEQSISSRVYYVEYKDYVPVTGSASENS